MLDHTCIFCKIVGALLIIGAINWGLVGAFDFNLVDYIFGVGSVVARIIYIVVGLAGLAGLIGYFKDCACCKK